VKLEIGQIVSGRYKIAEILGSGGMSVVYRAYDKHLDRNVTFKVLKEEYLNDTALVERFPEEARKAACLNHQNIAGVYDQGSDGNILYIVLEYVEGSSLKEYITNKAPFDDETTLGVAIQVAEGLCEAHLNKIIHLDVKPQNILIANNSIVKVTDFGIARASRQTTREAKGVSMGSVHYSSPEQSRGGEVSFVDEKSDVYSLGIVMFEMATGKLPFDGPKDVAVAMQQLNDPLPDILQYNPDASDSLIKIIYKATEKSASMRYKSMEDMLTDLKIALTDKSGDFVVAEDDINDSPTRHIPQEELEALRRQQQRAAFLDGEDFPEDELASGVQGGNIEDDYDDYTRYPEDYPRKPKPRPDEKKKDSIAVYGGIILGVILTAVIVIFMRRFFGDMLSPNEVTVETPSVVGKSWVQAELELRTMGLVAVREDGFCDDDDCDNCEDTVLLQRVDPGRMLSPQDVVQLVVSAGKASNGSFMPNVTTKPLDDATSILEALDLDLIFEINLMENEAVTEAIVMQTNPEMENIVRRGGTVVLTVFVPVEEDIILTVPRLVGLEEEDAISLLEENSLVVGEIIRQENVAFPEGQVIRVAPAVGTQVEPDTEITLIISSGTEPLPTPQPTPEPEETPEPDNTTPDNTPAATQSETTPSTTPTVDTTPTTPPEATPIEATPTTPEVTPPAQEFMDGTLTIHLWAVPEGTETVHLVIERQLGNEEPEPLFNDPYVPVTRTVISVPVQYIDPTVFRIYSVENGVRILRATENWPVQ